jgi:hypothetical protein
MVKPNGEHQDKITNLQIFSQHIRCLGQKTDELVINLPKDAPHILCLSELHLSAEMIKNVSTENYKLGAFYCSEKIKCGGVYIYISTIRFSL